MYLFYKCSVLQVPVRKGLYILQIFIFVKKYINHKEILKLTNKQKHQKPTTKAQFFFDLA